MPRSTMRTTRTILFTLTLLFALAFMANAQDAIRVSAVYNRTDFPLVKSGDYEVTKNVNGFTVEGDVRVFNKAGFRASLAANLKQTYNVEVYPDYDDGMNIVDLYRDVRTYSGFAQIGYTVRYIFEPFAALGYGTRKIHMDTPRQTVRTLRLGVNVPFKEESPFFIKAYVDFDKPYGRLPSGFINPDTRTLGIGAGFRFGGSRHGYPKLPAEKLPAGF